MSVVTIGGIPVFNALITDAETGMYKISLVDDPAVMSNFLAFDNARKCLMYKVEDEEKRLVRGVVMRADFPIYRYDRNFGEYYIIYKAEQIRIMAEKYLLESRQNNVNLMHEDDTDVEGVQMVQYFIKNSEEGVSPSGFEDIADGSLFAEFHIVNDEVWDAIKEGTYKGFSLEGIFDLQPEKDAHKTSEIVETLQGKFSNYINKGKMGRLNRLKTALLKAFAEFASMTTDKGVLVWDGEDDLKVGDNVFVEDAEGNRTPAATDDYTNDDGVVVVVADGIVSEIRTPEVDIEAPEAEETTEEVENAKETTEETAEETTEEVVEEPTLTPVATDKGDLYCDGELAEGKEVFELDAESNIVPAEDGDYVLDNGTTIKVAEGKVAEIAEAAEVAETEDAPAEDVEAIKAENEALKAEVKILKAQVETLKAQPMAHSAHEEVVTSKATINTGDKGLDRLSRLLKK